MNNQLYFIFLLQIQRQKEKEKEKDVLSYYSFLRK
jgi:hypothetical protein